MAGAEVSVSSEELLTVRDEEGEYSGSDQKSQVILHLQPILHGVNDDIAETGTTVLAIETHRDDSERDGDEIEYGYPITCGDSRAVLLFKKFVCPGINVRCVKFNDQLISPKQFVHLAGKATLKDWKRAIRLGGVMLRKMMDSGQIDFYQHDTLCSNTCHSTKFDVLINRTRLPPGNSVQPSLSCLALDPVGGQVSPVTDGVLSLWKGVADCGMMGEVLSNLQTELFSTCKRVELHSENGNLQETDVMLLNSLCEMFGLLDSVKQAMDLRHSQTEKKKTQNSIYEFDELSEDERKQSCDKRISRKASSLKHLRTQRKSQTSSHFQNLLSSVKTATVIQPHSVTGLCAASCTHLAINPQLFAHFSAFTGQRHHAGSSRTDRDVKSGTLEGEQEISEADNQEKFHRPGQEGNKRKDTSGIHKEPGQRSVKFWGDSRVRSEGNEATEGLRDIEKMIMGRKASKKHKSK
ncbi:glucocorticoid modulatory element-binding protein 1-like [Archocentrus centrarchus]|uniref:glucocorticoid modulatory element-binding protein 1-like n=1 Tax=Archocentrus centrarchus TaxID=63155 RepID=UPI0011EA0CAF|nr:glucocorticoid modulatory element-binding protein 1-like [Archocentrus centrarchus]XP_030604880.1 glucocorticoid modulatory element-binding protein 1-like [Archocentrus centrarchus]